MMFDFIKLQQQYQNDTVFCTLVDILASAIHAHGLTPLELRQIAFFASTKYELENIKARLIKQETTND